MTCAKARIPMTARCPNSERPNSHFETHLSRRALVHRHRRMHAVVTVHTWRARRREAKRAALVALRAVRMACSSHTRDGRARTHHWPSRGCETGATVAHETGATVAHKANTVCDTANNRRRRRRRSEAHCAHPVVGKRTVVASPLVGQPMANRTSTCGRNNTFIRRQQQR